jgi:alcohol dehydrogenase, propanol-preferring
MRAWRVARPGPVDSSPLDYLQVEVPEPGAREVRVKVSACGVCRTDLHIAEGDLPEHRPGVVPGHEVVGTVDALGAGSSRFRLGDRIGIAWLRATCGRCRFCAIGRENLCPAARFTGWDADGGYADYAVVPESYAYKLPASFDDERVAPLLCAGIIGFRALRRSHLPPGGRLGIYGFGGSGHITAQVALFEGATVHVMTRSREAHKLALRTGVASVQDPFDRPPERLDAAILFAPVGALVPSALSALERGGRLAIAGIHLSALPGLDYREHLFEEKEIVSVMANTRGDGEDFLELAPRVGIEVTTTPFALEEAGDALKALAGGRVAGAAVLHVT